MEKKKAVGFDLDGTLIKVVWPEAHKKWYEHFGVLNKGDKEAYSKWAFKEDWYEGVKIAMNDFYRGVDVGPKAINKTARSFFGALNLQKITELIKEKGLWDVLIKESLEMAKLVKEKGYEPIIISNQPEIVVDGVTYLINKNYEEIFTNYYGSLESEEPNKKRVWKRALKEWEVVLYLADTKKDIEIAREQGINAFLVPWAENKEKEGIGEERIISIDKLEEILK